MSMTLIIIAAHDPNLVIGKNGKLPWKYSKDLKHFKSRTMGHPLLMGRRVFEEIGEQPLPGRTNIVLSRTRTYNQVPTYSSIEAALDFAESKNFEKLFIIGGAEIYKAFLARVDYLYITEIHTSYSGDTYFPEYRNNISTIWKEISREDHKELSFVDYKRK